MAPAEWLATLRRQLDFQWISVLRPRFEGLTDDEYLWEPAPGCWSVRPAPGGRFTIDWVRPEPQLRRLRLSRGACVTSAQG